MLERLKLLETNIAELERFKAENSIEKVKHNTQKEWSLRYGLLESIQIIIDISCHISNKLNLGTPQSYSECVELLKKYEYLNPELSEELIGMVGLRNLLIHEYATIDVSKLYSLLNYLSDFSEFSEAVKRIIE